jgi:hypothetical protein
LYDFLKCDLQSVAKEVTIVDQSQTDVGETASVQSDTGGHYISSTNMMNEPRVAISSADKDVGISLIVG